MSKKRDYYAKALRYFRAHPDKIFSSWQSPYDAKYGKLFQYMSPDGYGCGGGMQIGCPTMIKYGLFYPFSHRIQMNYKATKDSITKMCKNANLPDMNKYSKIECAGRHITLKQAQELVPYLKEFAKIQRAADKELNRVINF